MKNSNALTENDVVRGGLNDVSNPPPRPAPPQGSGGGSKYAWPKELRQLLEDCAAVMADKLSQATERPFSLGQAEAMLMPHFRHFINSKDDRY